MFAIELHDASDNVLHDSNGNVFGDQETVEIVEPADCLATNQGDAG